MKSINQGFEVHAPITTESGVEEDNQVGRGEDQMITEAQVPRVPYECSSNKWQGGWETFHPSFYK